KGIIEQHFRTINTNSTVFLPGKVKPDMSERGGKDYRLDAKLDIRQFTAIIIKCVLYYNNFHYMGFFEKSKQMMEAGVEAIPVKLWNWGIRFCSGALRVVSEEKAKFALMPSERASVTSKGIRFKGLYYSSQEAEENLWFEKARSKGSYKITVSYDPRDMGRIYAWDGADGTYLTCDLLDWEEKFSGKQLAEVQYEQEKEKLEKKRHHALETEAKINLGREIESIVKQTERTTEPMSKRSKAERLRGIKQNRKEEREQIRKEESFTEKEPVEAKPSYPTEEEEMSPVLRMIRRKMEASIKDESLYGEGTVSGTDDSGIPGKSSH
ncbi:MAG: Mu transposase C-terminal domain-containing protein, partial [Abditibacteriota bacterium]|nr:Mu transposase C-terminal domain-containing protein [Abditibacteriota bacterium]